jgi:hypothetical protein
MAEGLHLVAAILAHQGGWDEILLVLTPIVVIVVILRLVKQRVDANAGPGTIDDIDDIDDVTRR